jgi:hypothetical protein
LFNFRQKDEGDDDVVDSDFSIDENDEPISDHEEEGTKRKRKVATKAYKVRLKLSRLTALKSNFCSLSQEPPAKQQKTNKPKPRPARPKYDKSKRIRTGDKITFTVLDSGICIQRVAHEQINGFFKYTLRSNFFAKINGSQIG